MGHPRILLADPHALMVDCLRELLRDEFQVVGEMGDGRTVLTGYEALRPDVLLLEISLPILNGIEVVRRIRKKFPSALMIFVTMFGERTFVDEAFRAGASGYIPKEAPFCELRDAILTVLRGRTYLSPRLCSGTASDSVGAVEAEDQFGHKLTPRRRDVLQLIAEGKRMPEIADILGISARTVEFHKNGVIAELGLRTIAELTRYAISHKISI